MLRASMAPPPNRSALGVPTTSYIWNFPTERWFCLMQSRLFGDFLRERIMNGLIYLIGLIVVVMIILSFLGLR
jgi:hypothetical protein